MGMPFFSFLCGMNVLVTGGSSGIGKAVCLKLSSLGHQISTSTRKHELVDSLRLDLKSVHPAKADALVMQAELSEEKSCLNFIQTVEKQQGLPDVLILNAGEFRPGLPLEMGIDELEQALEGNAKHAIRICKMLVPAMVKRNKGTIVFIGTILNHEPRAGACAYTLAKTLLNGYSRMLQEELRNTAIRITRIQPGSVDTPSFDGEIVPREKFIKPAQIADAIEWIIRLPESVQVEEMIIRPTDKNW
jgi:NADP-dependent 3-hydroxy acid dehydrogenase YdfG